MSSHLLPIISANATYELGQALPFVRAGKLPAQHMHVVWDSFRRRAIADFLLECRVEALYLGLHKSAAAFAHHLTTVASDEQKETSKSQPLFDAIACADWATALAIAKASRATRNMALEYEEDFLYVWFVVQYLKEEPFDVLRAIVERLGEIVVDRQPQLDVCQALLARDAGGFGDALERMIDAHRARWADRLAAGLASDEEVAVEAPLFIEGMALLRLGERAGFPAISDYPLIPSLAMSDRIPAYAPDDWWQG